MLIKRLGHILCDPDKPLKQRFRALFALRNIGNNESVDCIAKCFNDSSALLKHELAYCLGQMQNPHAVPILEVILQAKSEHPMVRHEAGEALGAIGQQETLKLLREYCDDPSIEVAQTCELAVGNIRWLHSPERHKQALPANPYFSVDPTPPSETNDLQTQRDVLLDNNLPLFDRYRQIFSLRNRGGTDAVLALADGLKCKESALFRHEIAYVLGQMQHAAAVPQLVANLRDKSENCMVRHECAEALGAIATDDCMEVLREYLNDDDRVVRESCEVALDMCKYENSDEFQYAQADGTS